jgi:hypothetical protein
MDMRILTKENFLLYAIGNYSNCDCSGIEEFTEDLSKIKYIKRLLKKYTRTGNIRPILLLNHLMILGNIFGPQATSRMLFFKLESQIHSPLKTVLLYLNFIEENTILDNISVNTIPIDQPLATLLLKTTEISK